MNMTQEMLEILIGKYLDSEITPSEQRMLEAAMERDPQTRELLEQLLELHQHSREVISSEVLEQGKAAEEIFEQVWQQRTKSPLHRLTKVGGNFRFAAGLAAGLVIGLTVHFALPARSTPKSSQVPEKRIVQEVKDETNIKDKSLQVFPPKHTQNVSHNVDWYSFTDEDGDQWLIEGLRENVVTPAAYNADL